MKVLTNERIAVSALNAKTADAGREIDFNLSALEGIVINGIEGYAFEQATTTEAVDWAQAISRDLSGDTVDIDGASDEGDVDVVELFIQYVGGQKVAATATGGGSRLTGDFVQVDYRNLPMKDRPLVAGNLRHILDVTSGVSDTIDARVVIHYQRVQLTAAELGLIRAAGR